jgi:hypothetical protein
MAEDAHFRLRLPADLHRQLAELAEKNHRSINSEIVSRLQESVASGDYDIPSMAEQLEEFERRLERVERYALPDDHE